MKSKKFGIFNLNKQRGSCRCDETEWRLKTNNKGRWGCKW